jgi:hypothetical protein
MSVEHPFVPTRMNVQDGREANYFAISNRTEEYDFSGQPALLSLWDRPLHAMTGAFTAAGFQMTAISEPEPAPAARELFPDQIPPTTTSSPRRDRTISCNTRRWRR